MSVRRWISGAAAAACMAAGSAACGEDSPPARRREPVSLTEKAMAIHRSAILVDGHNDLPYKIRGQGESSFDVRDVARMQPDLDTDIPRLRAGGVGAQFWAAYVPAKYIGGGSARVALEQIDLIHRMIDRYPETFEWAGSADDIERIHRAGRIASLIGIEGGHAIENSLALLRMYHRLGVRYMTLTHSKNLDWADASTDEARLGGLSPFGEQVVLEMNRIGMLVDISHVSADVMRHVLRVARAPVIASHSSARAIAPHPRNVPDDVLEAVAANGGVVMVNFYSGFIVPEGAQALVRGAETFAKFEELYPDENDYRAAMAQWARENPYPAGSVHDVVDHIEHVMRVAGPDHVGLGSDFDGVTKLPEQLKDVSMFPNITQELLNRGHDAATVRKVLGGNFMRVFREAEAAAGRLQQGG